MRSTLATRDAAKTPWVSDHLRDAKVALGDAIQRWHLEHDGEFDFTSGRATIVWTDDEVTVKLACT